MIAHYFVNIVQCKIEQKVIFTLPNWSSAGAVIV